MPRLKRFIPFGPFAPDRSRFDLGSLREAENVLPLFNSYSVIPKIQTLSTNDVGDEITGGHVHFYTVAAGDQFGYPVSNESNVDGNWVALQNEDNELYEQIDNRAIDDATRIFVAGNEDTVTARTATIYCSNLDAPVITTGDRTLKFRYRVQNHETTNDWSIQVKLTEPGETLSLTTTITGSADTDWEEHTFAMNHTTLDTDVVDWDGLAFQVIATVPGGDDQEFYPASDKGGTGDWKKEDDSLSTLYESLDDDAPTDDTYVQSPNVKVGAGTYQEFWWAGSGAGELNNDSDPRYHSDHVLSWRWKANVSDLKGRVQLKEFGKETPIAEEDEILVPTSFTDDSIALSTTEAASIDDYTQLYTNIRFYNDADATAASDAGKNYPYKDGTGRGGVSAKPWYSDLVDSDDAVTVPSGSPNPRFNVFLNNIEDNGSYESWSVVVEAKSASANGDMLIVVFKDDGTEIARLAESSVGTSYADYTIEISEEDAEEWAQAGADYRIRISNTASSNTLTVRQAYVSAPAVRYGQVSQLKLSIPDNASAEISQLNIVIPTQYNYRVGDRTEVFVGVSDKLWRVQIDEDINWEDVSIAAGYDTVATNKEYAQSWGFASWGSDVLATNFIDPVQKFVPAAPSESPKFANLITSDEKPQGKYIVVVNNFVVLGNISSNGLQEGTTSGQPDEVWWSAIDDATDFDPSPVTQCDRQRLVPTPGEITGMVGGEFGIIFKRNSIYRMNYVGSPAIFTFDLLSRTVGTEYPKSIVAVNDDVYFYSQGGLYVIRNGESVEPIDANAVNRMLQDREFEDNSVREFVHSDERERNSYVVAAYDEVSKLIYWSIRRKGSDPAPDSDEAALMAGDSDVLAYRNDFILVYNPEEHRFSYILDEDNLAIAWIGALPNVAGGSRIDRNIFLLGPNAVLSTVYNYQNFNAGNERYAATFKTNVIASTALLGEENTGTNIVIRRIRPIYWEQPAEEETQKVDVSITVTVSDNPLLEKLTLAQTLAEQDTVTDDDMDEDRWFPLKLMAGEFFQVEMSFTADYDDGVREVLGFEIDFEPEGEF